MASTCEERLEAVCGAVQVECRSTPERQAYRIAVRYQPLSPAVEQKLAMAALFQRYALLRRRLAALRLAHEELRACFGDDGTC